MAELDYKERFLIEKLFDMPTGYVMDFSNNTFQSFIYDSIKVNIYDDKYFYASGSKANRLRAFFTEEPSYKVGQLLTALLDYWHTKAIANENGFDFERDKNIYTECLKIAKRLKEEKIVEEIEVIKEKENDKDFSLLAKSIRESIDKNEPEAALDRLHTYVMKYIRQLCENHTIEIKKDESLNAIFGKYVKFIVSHDKIESKMTERILKYSIHVIEAFNDIRNNKSFAHDNPILNYSESVLIFNNVTNSIKFIESVEKTLKQENKKEETESADWEDLPF
ncbi:abortive infection family protein [Zobellia uliginosa]|uniref:abortive infection family protein n=1 Tax=Zobellia uliginosa TaxID=143224 RepID=UPI0026E3F228|nr:abortive infection family protein [Zobellia uliginosa]MDO6519931.1 abortive infection family protein [Zobellia uliginosa]